MKQKGGLSKKERSKGHAPPAHIHTNPYSRTLTPNPTVPMSSRPSQSRMYERIYNVHTTHVNIRVSHLAPAFTHLHLPPLFTMFISIASRTFICPFSLCISIVPGDKARALSISSSSIAQVVSKRPNFRRETFISFAIRTLD